MSITLTELTDINKIEEIAEVYFNKAGNIPLTAKAIGINRATLWTWVREENPLCPVLSKAFKEVRESMIDLAESQLMANILKGKETSLIFFLLNRAPERWQDKRNLQFSGSVDHKVTCEELAKRWQQMLGLTPVNLDKLSSTTTN